MPGDYPPDVECCIYNQDGTDCTARVEHSFAFATDKGVHRMFFCELHWVAGARDAMRRVVNQLEGVSDE